MDVNWLRSSADRGLRYASDDPTAIAAARARGGMQEQGKRRSPRLRVALASAIHGLTITLLAGCGTSFEEGDEAWVELPGTSWPYDEYAVVEIVSLADDRARVELIERLPVVEGQRMWDDVKSSSANRLLKRLEAGRSTYVAEDGLIPPEDGERDLEAKRSIAQLTQEFAPDPAAFCYRGEAADMEAVLRAAEQRDLEEVVGPLRLLLDFVEKHAAIAQEDLDLEQAYASVRESADALGDEWAGSPRAYRELLAALAQGYGPTLREAGGAFAPGSMTSLPLGAAVSMMTAVCLVIAVDSSSSPYASSAFTTELSLSDSSDTALDATTARLEAEESVGRLITRDGKQKWLDEPMREWITVGKQLIAADVAGLALEAATEAGDITHTDDAEDVLARAREFAEPFEEHLDFAPIWGAKAIQMYGALVRSSQAEVANAIAERDLERAAAEVQTYLERSRELGGLYARHDKSKLVGANANEHADAAGRRLFERIRPSLGHAAAEVLGSASNEFDSQALADREPRVRELLAPIETALGREVLDDAFFHDARQKAKVNTQRRLLGVGQVWKGTILCGEATDYRQHRAGSSRRGARYHGPEHLGLTLEILEAGRQGARMTFQGKLTAQNLPSRTDWRYRDQASGSWRNTRRPGSTQFVTLTYQPDLLTVAIAYGVLDHAAHVERYGEGRDYTGNVEGAWQRFQGQGTMAPSPPSITGRMVRRYIDNTCTEFSLAPEQPASSRAEFVLEDEGTPEDRAEAMASSGDAGKTNTSSPLSGLTEQTYIGGMKSRGMKVYAMSESGDWCRENVVFKVEADSEGVFADGTVTFYMRRFGQRIHEDQFCPAARSVDILGYAGASPEPLFRGRATAAGGWSVN